MYLYIGQRLYYRDKNTGAINFVIVTYIDGAYFSCRLLDGRRVTLHRNVLGYRLFYTRELDNIPRMGCRPDEVPKLYVYNYHPYYSFEMPYRFPAPEVPNLCENCEVYLDGKCCGIYNKSCQPPSFFAPPIHYLDDYELEFIRKREDLEELMRYLNQNIE